jgi:glycerophosphoryl diester phosphodiesterase
VGHRGASREHPENTMAAFTAAKRAGADGIELDVRLSRDGVAMVCHDANLQRFGHGRTPMHRYTSAQLQSLDMAGWFRPRPPAGKQDGMPTLAQVLRRFPGLQVLIELKPTTGRGAHAANQRLVHAVAATIRQTRASGRVLILCFSAMLLEMMGHCAPGLTLVRNVERRPGDLCRWLDGQPFIDVVCADRRILDRALVAQCHLRGLRVFTYTCNEATTVRQVHGLGVDGVLSDRPAWLVSAVRNRP